MGFEMSSGEAVLFLDADDVVSPDVARALPAVWHPKVSNGQLQMRAVDARLAHVGAFVPHFRFTISPPDVPEWVLTTLAYAASPGSGYACSRWFLERLFPPSEVADRYGANSRAAATPLPMNSGRVDGANTGAMTERDPGRLGREIQHAIERHRYGNTHGRPQRRRIAPEAWRISLQMQTLLYSIGGSWRLNARPNPVTGDRRLMLLRCLWLGWRRPQALPAHAAATIRLWGRTALVALPAIAARLVLRSCGPQTRPQAIRRRLAWPGNVCR